MKRHFGIFETSDKTLHLVISYSNASSGENLVNDSYQETCDEILDKESTRKLIEILELAAKNLWGEGWKEQPVDSQK